MMQLTFRFKLMVGIIFACLMSIIIVTGVCYYIARGIIVKNAFENMVSMREEKKQQIEAYYELMRSQVKVWSDDKTTIQAYKEFSKAFYAINKDAFKNFDAIDQALKTYYQKQYLTKLNLNVSEKRTIDLYYKSVNDRTKILQYYYTADNPNPLGKKIDLISSKINNDYDVVHKSYHPLFRKWVDEFGYYDVFIVDAQSGDILYTAFKETDFATNLLSGPYKNTPIAQAFRAAQLGATADIVIVTDFEPYDPSYSAPAAFIASPIVENEKKLGVLILQIPIDRINNIMTDNKKWEDVGLGKTGETYLLGADHKMRSVSRFFLEDPVGYVAKLEKLKVDPLVIDEIRLLSTTILLQQINTPAAIDAIRGATGAIIETSYLDYEALTAYSPLALKDLNWNIISEISTQEKFDDLYILLRNIGIAGIIIMILLVLFTFLFSKSLVGPLEKLVSKYQGVIGDSASSADSNMILTGSYEVNQLMYLFDRLVLKIDERMQSLDLIFEYLKNTYNQLSVINATLDPALQETTSSVQASGQQIINTMQDEMRGFLQNYSVLSQSFKDSHALFMQSNHSFHLIDNSKNSIKNSVESLKKRDTKITLLIEEQKMLLYQIKSALMQKNASPSQSKDQEELAILDSITALIERVILSLKENDQEFFDVVRMIKEFEIQMLELENIYGTLQKLQNNQESQNASLEKTIDSLRNGAQTTNQNIEHLINLIAHITASYREIPPLTASLYKQYTQLESTLHAFKMEKLKD